MKLNIQADCGNSPKRELIRDLTIYFVSYDLEKAMEYMDENVVWTLVGDEPIKGKEPFAAALKEMIDNKAKELTIYSIVTHGKEAAVNGEMTMEDGNVFGFADFYEFASAGSSKVKAIRSYVIHKK